MRLRKPITYQLLKGICFKCTNRMQYLLQELLLVALLFVTNSHVSDPANLATCNENRIIGGDLVDINAVPFQVAILDYYDYFLCAGSIISSSWVLTAAHCITHGPLYIRANSSYYDNGGFTVGVQSIVLHPKFSWNWTFNYDLALLELEEQLSLDDHFYAAELPYVDEPVSEDWLLQISGWGWWLVNRQHDDYCEEPDSDGRLRAALVPLVNLEDCRNLNWGDEYVTDQMLCTGWTEDWKDACCGDSGGPLVFNSIQLVGVISYRKGCGFPGYPTIYARVSASREWIFVTAGV